MQMRKPRRPKVICSSENLATLLQRKQLLSLLLIRRVYEQLDGIIATAGGGCGPHEVNRSEPFKVVVCKDKPQSKSLPHVKSGGKEKTDVDKAFLFEVCCGEKKQN